MSTMNAESAAFVPSSSRGRKLSSANNVDNTSNSHASLTHSSSEASTTPSSKIPRSTSAHTSLAAAESQTKSANTGSSSSSSHARSSSLPGNGASSTSERGRGRGGSSSRGRGAGRGGRGGSRGASNASSSSSHLPKKPTSPPSRPPVALDSVDEFPALGGGPVAAPTSSSNTASTAANAGEASSGDSPSLSKSSPTLSPSQSMKGLSFARVVAPAPPPSQPPSSTSNNAQATSSVPSTSTTTTASASSQSPASSSKTSSVSDNTHATSPTTSMSPNMGIDAEAVTATAAPSKGQPQATAGGKKKKKRSSKDQTQQGQGQNAGQNQNQGAAQNQPQGPHDAFNMYNTGYSEGFDRDPFNIVVPDHHERPYFEQQQQQQQNLPEQQQSSPQPGLTPVQIAFLAANGLSVEGMPNLPNDAAAGMSLEALQEYYAPLQPQAQMEQVHASGKGGATKKEGGKKGKKGGDRSQAGHPNASTGAANGWNGAPGAGPSPYGSFNPQGPQYPYFDPQYYDEQQQYAGQYPEQGQPPFDTQQSYQESQVEGQQQQGSQQPPLTRQNGSFHFHPDVPSFQPRHLHADVPEFKPRSPVLHADAPVFVPPPQVTSQPSQESNEEEVKAPNGFVSAVEGLEETPNQNEDSSPKKSAAKTETAAEHTEDNGSSPTVAEGIKAQIDDTIESVKQTASELISSESSEQAEAPQPKTDDKEEEAQETETKGHQAEENAEQPHSTFSLLPPVTVEDVLDKAQSLATSVKETAQDAVESVEETVQSVSETVTETFSGSATETEDPQQATKDNLDELAIPNEEEAADAAEEAPTASEEAPTAHDVVANLEELDLQDDKEIEEIEAARHSKESSSTTASSSLAPEQSQYSLSPSEVEHELATATEGQADMPALQAEIEAVAQTSFPSSSTPRFEIISQSEDSCVAEDVADDMATPCPPITKPAFETISVSEDICDIAVEGNTTTRLGPCSDIQIVSTSQEQCTPEQQTRTSRSATLDSLASTESAVPFVRSMAPSPDSRVEELAPAAAPPKREIPALSIPTQMPPVVISPSTPISPEQSPIRPSMISSPKPLSKTWERPSLDRQVSEAEKDEAIRLVRQLRSEPSTPLVESEEMLAPTSSGTANPSSEGESTESDTFKFDLSGRFSELNSSKRKRGKGEDEDEDEEEDPDKKERKVDSGEAPSLTMSIFSGSILPRKQFVVSILASLGINLFLPFVNGVMLGFGEIFARDWLGPIFGFGRKRSNTKDDSSNNNSKSFSASGLGLRGAGNKRGGAQDVPGHAAAKTAVEAVTEEVISGPSKL